MNKNSSFTDDGWAFWVDGDDTSTIYFNEWLNPRGKNYVDLGIHIRGILETAALHVYIPYRIEHDEIEDVSLKISTQKLLYAIFGASGIIDYKKNDFTSELAYNGKVMDLVHMSAIDFECRPVAEGTLLDIPFDELKPNLANDDAYLIFRIPHKSLDEVFAPNISVMSALKRLQSLIMSPMVSEHFGYSVRINESRRLPIDVIRMSAFHRQKLKKASVMISLPADYETDDVNCYRVRRLETGLYEGYLPESFDGSDAVAYQWKKIREKNLRGHFNFYFTIRHDYIKKASVIIYTIILVMTGAAGNAVWELIKKIASLF